MDMKDEKEDDDVSDEMNQPMMDMPDDNDVLRTYVMPIDQLNLAKIVEEEIKEELVESLMDGSSEDIASAVTQINNVLDDTNDVTVIDVNTTELMSEMIDLEANETATNMLSR